MKNFSVILFLLICFSCGSNKNLTSAKNNFKFESDTFLFNDKRFKKGDKIDKAINALGKYDRSKSFISLDSIFIWDKKGIAISTDNQNNSRINEVFIFLNNMNSNKKYNDSLFFKKLENHFKSIYENKNIDEIIEENYFVNNSYANNETRNENRKLILEEIKNKMSSTYIYPEETFVGKIFINGTYFTENDNLFSLNKKLIKKSLMPFSYELDLYDLVTMNSDSLMEYMSNEKFKNNSHYGSFDKKVTGIYTSKDSTNQSISIMITNNKMEYIKF